MMKDSNAGLESIVADSQELVEFVRTAKAFQQYRANAISDCVDYRRDFIYRLPRWQRQIYHSILSPQLDRVEQKILENAEICEKIGEIGMQWAQQWGATLANFDEIEPTVHSYELVLSSLRQIAREWSPAGAVERAACFAPITDFLRAHFHDPHGLAVFCPGSGLGRLPFEIAAMGFDATANEYSINMLFTSYFILNFTAEPLAHTMYPYVHNFSANRDGDAQVFRAQFPDVSPTLLLEKGGSLNYSTGDFIECSSKIDKVDVIVTCFFVDATPNILETISCITQTVKNGGLWLNFGPLLWHYENVRDETERTGGAEIDFDNLYQLIQTFGWTIVERSTHETTYCANPRSMLKHWYECDFFAARLDLEEPTA